MTGVKACHYDLSVMGITITYIAIVFIVVFYTRGLNENVKKGGLLLI